MTPIKKTSSQKKKKAQETAIQQIVNHYFKSKGLSLDEIKKDAKKKKDYLFPLYSTSKNNFQNQLDPFQMLKKAITKVARWASSRNLDYAIETVFKKWLELDRLKPKEIVKKPYYRDDPMVWSETKKKWFVISSDGDWKEFADDESKIKWKINKK